MVIDFQLPNHEEEIFTFDATFREQHNSLLFWYRGSWWPFCVRQIVDLIKLEEKLDHYNLSVLLISADSPQDNQKFRSRHEIPFLVLSDEMAEVAPQYQIPLSKKHPKAYSYSNGFIQPAVFVYRGEEEVFRFIQEPKMTNLWGAARRPQPEDILNLVSSQLG